MKRPCISFEVKISAGVDIGEACKQSVRLAKKLEVHIWFKFNSVKCLARPADDPEDIVNGYLEVTKPDYHGYKIACASVNS